MLLNKKYIFFIFLLAVLWIFSNAVYSQGTKGLKPIKMAENTLLNKTRAVIIGVSDYQNEGITDLQYAHRDAEIFAEFLCSTPSFNVDSNDVILLTNENATAGKVITALYGLIEDSKEGDQIFIYFSGHGDVESTTISQPGFLLCWDAPSKVYMSGGTFGLGYLQEIISTLSIKTKAKVILITDACRAGKLAGNTVGGVNATALNLSKQYANELKILSCQPDEFALEGKQWGEGRGVFSYYLIAGLKGLADTNDDGTVSLLEIERYLEDSVSKSVAPHNQMPMTVGQKSNSVFAVDAKIKSQTIEEFRSSKLSFGLVEDDVISLCNDSLLYKKLEAFKYAISTKNLLPPKEASAWDLYHDIKDDGRIASQKNSMKRALAAALQDDAQQALNRYLAADPNELTKRWALDTSYADYALSLSKAASLLGPEHLYYNKLQSKIYYFKGLNKRLNALKNGDENLIKEAVIMQDSCLYYDQNAAHCFNERGLTYYKLNKYDECLDNYRQAASLSPQWPLVWSNQCAAYNTIGRIQEAITCGQKAIMVDSTFALAYYNVGESYLLNKDTVTALEYLIKGLAIDSMCSSINDKFGLLAYQKGQYDTAHIFWTRALTTEPTSVQIMINLGHNCLARNDTISAKQYFTDALQLRPHNLEAQQGMIEYYFFTENNQKALETLLDYLSSHPHDTTAYYYTAILYSKSQDHTNALSMLVKAIENGYTDFRTIEDEPLFEKIIQSETYLLYKSKHKP